MLDLKPSRQLQAELTTLAMSKIGGWEIGLVVEARRDSGWMNGVGGGVIGNCVGNFSAGRGCKYGRELLLARLVLAV